MRLNQLDLTRYGKFTETRLTFGEQPESGPDFHVIYGPNEAGKSTLLSAWLDLLFQIPTRSPMNFQHSYSAMQLGAQFTIDGQTHAVTRIKKPSNSLLDAHGAPIAEGLMHTGLRGLNRDAYRAMFSLNGHTLTEGGESILASKGDLGELLFQASAGLSELGTRLDKLRAESESFLSGNGRKGRLLELNKQLDVLDQSIKTLDTAAAEYARLAAHRDEAKANWQTARQKHEAVLTASHAINRLMAALPIADRLTRLDAQITDYGDMPPPPPGWAEELPELDRANTALHTRVETGKQALAALKKQLHDTPQDSLVLDLADAIAAAERIKPAHDTALDDLPKRIKEREETAEKIAVILSRLEQDGSAPKDVILASSVMTSLRDLIEQRSGIETALNSAKRECERAKTEVTRAQEGIDQAGGITGDSAGLARLVALTRRDAPLAKLDAACTAQTDAANDEPLALATLRPWVGDGTAALALATPSPEWREATRTRLTALTRQFEQDKTEVARLTADMTQAAHSLTQIKTSAEISPDDLIQARTAREACWAAHRATLSVETADNFEKAMRLDDHLSAALAEQKNQASKTEVARQQVAELQSRLDVAQKALETSSAAYNAERHSIAVTISGLSSALPSDMSFEAFESWLDRLEKTVEKTQARIAAERTVTRCVEIADRYRVDLSAELTVLGQAPSEGTSLTVVLESAQTLIDQHASLVALKDSLTKARQDLVRRQSDLDMAEENELVWRDAWNATCAKTWMRAAPPDVSVMRAILPELDSLRAAESHFHDLSQRIAKMQSNQTLFLRAIRKISDPLLLSAETETAALWQSIVHRLRRAENDTQLRERLKKQIENETNTLISLKNDLKLHQERIKEISTYFNAESWPETRTALTRATERAQLATARDEAIEALCTQMQTPDLANALTQLQGQELAVLQARAISLKTELDNLNEAQQLAFATLREAESAVEGIGGDDAVAKLTEERQTLLLEIEDEARAHLRKRLGILAVDQALRRYRDTHRSGMLDRASEAFRTISQGAYKGLAAQPNGAHETLVALSQDGGSKDAAQLSDGARAQLYLALRIAGYYEFVRANGPVPFIADDIMETFDNDRSAEALGLLAQMSEHGQVIYLTHHAHLCDVARKVCPEVKLHNLGKTTGNELS